MTVHITFANGVGIFEMNDENTVENEKHKTKRLFSQMLT